METRIALACRAGALCRGPSGDNFGFAHTPRKIGERRGAGGYVTGAFCLAPS